MLGSRCGRPRALRGAVYNRGMGLWFERTRCLVYRRGSRIAGAAIGLCLVQLSACPQTNNSRLTPVCALRDCETGELIDDGCSADGRCKSCSNDCGGRVAPRNGAKVTWAPVP